jgi:hypothetical protein
VGKYFNINIFPPKKWREEEKEKEVAKPVFNILFVNISCL